jgi:DNA-binding CsgD family transcriptional regulator
MIPELVGRAEETAVVGRFTSALAQGPACLIWEGEAGIGKTLLWTATVEAARLTGYRVLASRPAESEASLSFASLADLLGDVADEICPILPPPQRRSLEAALLRVDADPEALDARALGMATHAGLVALAVQQPVVVAIDDFQWIDRATLRVLQFVARRFERERFGLMLARRSTGQQEPGAAIEQVLAPERVEIRHVGPMSIGALHRLIEVRRGVSLARPALLHLERASGGNPLLALDIVEALERAGQPITAEMILPVPASVERLVRQRLDALPAVTRRLLLAIASLARPEPETVEAITSGDDLFTVIRPAVDAGLLELEGQRLRFMHPLYRSAVYAAQPPEARRKMHRRLAAIVPDAEEAGRHTALGATPPDGAAAAAVAAGAESLYSKGALDGAAALYEHALRLSEPMDTLARAERTLALARILWELGDLDGSRTMLREAPRTGIDRRIRAELLLLEATHVLWSDGAPLAIPLYVDALRWAAGLPELEATVHLRIAYVADHDLAMAAMHARAAVDLVDGAAGAEELLASALLLLAELRLLIGDGYDATAVARGRALLARRPNLARSATTFDARAVARERSWIIHEATDGIRQARVELEAIRRDDALRGRERGMPIMLADLVELCCWLGDLPAARAYADEAAGLLGRTGRAPYPEAASLFASALVAEHEGDMQRAAQLSADAQRLAQGLGPSPLADRVSVVRGRIALSLDRPREAIAAFAAVEARLDAAGARHPLVYRFRGDQIEGLVLAGEVTAANEHLSQFEVAVRKTATPWGLAVVARSRALAAAASGRLGDAQAEINIALEHHAGLAMPIEYGRTLLLLGRVRRRQRRKRPAREAFIAARDSFASAGAAGWEGAARRELDRVGFRGSMVDGLTPTEWEVARLAASGMTNRQVADAMVLSPKTTDAALTRVYTKLGIHSRAELGAWIALGPSRQKNG